jgi:hypothetical protein
LLGDGWRRGRGLCGCLRRRCFALWRWFARRRNFAWLLDFARLLGFAWLFDFTCLGTRLFHGRPDTRDIEVCIADLAAHRLEIDGVLRGGDRLALGLGRSSAEV